MPPTPPPALPLPAFPELRRVRPKTAFAGGLRARWRDRTGNIYEWDYQHAAMEKYDQRGRHLGEFHAATGERTKPETPSHRVHP